MGLKSVLPYAAAALTSESAVWRPLSAFLLGGCLEIRYLCYVLPKIYQQSAYGRRPYASRRDAYAFSRGLGREGTRPPVPRRRGAGFGEIFAL